MGSPAHLTLYNCRNLQPRSPNPEIRGLCSKPYINPQTYPRNLWRGLLRLLFAAWVYVGFRVSGSWSDRGFGFRGLMQSRKLLNSKVTLNEHDIIQ